MGYTTGHDLSPVGTCVPKNHPYHRVSQAKEEEPSNADRPSTIYPLLHKNERRRGSEKARSLGAR